MVEIVSCSKCRNISILYVPASNSNLCKKHFFEKFEKTFKHTIREFNLLSNTRRLGVALSGGKDSSATLCLLHPIAQQMGIELIALTIDEGIAGYRDKSIEAAAKLCKTLDVEHVVKSYKNEIGFKIDDIVKLKERDPACSYCGVFRRWLLNKSARELNLDKLALGHNLDDVAQTVMMNILRNEPFRLARFGPISGVVEDESFVPRIKPLMRIPEKWVALWAMLHDIPIHTTDCPNAHEAFRNNVREFINGLEEKYPGTKYRILNSFLSIKKPLEDAFSNSRLSGIGKCSLCNEPSSSKICKRCEMIAVLSS